MEASERLILEALPRLLKEVRLIWRNGISLRFQNGKAAPRTQISFGRGRAVKAWSQKNEKKKEENRKLGDPVSPEGVQYALPGT